MSFRIILVDNTDIPNLNHRDIKNKASGASESQFYNFIGELSKLNMNMEILCYNTSTKSDEIIDNITYKNIHSVLSDTFFDTDRIILQRYCSLITLFRNKTNKFFIWFHDIPCNNSLYVPNLPLKQSLEYLYINKNIHFIFNSLNSQQRYLYHFLNEGIPLETERFQIIYNILYENEFKDISPEPVFVNKNTLVFASAWCKGIRKIIDLFQNLIQKKPELKLILLSPGYDYSNWEDYRKTLEATYPNEIKIYGPLNKKEYKKIIQSALCVLSAPFWETFGCVFAESYYLGTPVIADIRSGAVREIIDTNYIVNYEEPEKVLQKIEELQRERDTLSIQLDKKFLVESNINLWKKFVLSL